MGHTTAYSRARLGTDGVRVARAKAASQAELPVQAVDRPILCNPYSEPDDHWVYDKDSGAADHGGGRRPASYWYRTEHTGTAQMELIAEEERELLPLVNLLRDDVRLWRRAQWAGATNVTKDLLRHWWRKDRGRRLFFCQLEAVETITQLAATERVPSPRFTDWRKLL